MPERSNGAALGAVGLRLRGFESSFPHFRKFFPLVKWPRKIIKSLKFFISVTNMLSKRSIIRAYIKKNPSCTYRDIRRDTKIKVERVYSSMIAAYEDAEVPLPNNLKKLNFEDQRNKVICYIRSNPDCTVTDIRDKLSINVSRVFGKIEHAFKLANVTYMKKLSTSGVQNTEVLRRCKLFEENIIKRLRFIGDVQAQVRIHKMIIDCILTYKNVKYVVEIKDFQSRNNITKSQIKQLLIYMDLTGISRGILICPKNSFPKRKNGRNLYIEGKNIKIVSIEEIEDGGVV